MKKAGWTVGPACFQYSNAVIPALKINYFSQVISILPK